MTRGPPEEPTRLQEDQREREDAPDYYYESRIEAEAEETEWVAYTCGRTRRYADPEQAPDECGVCGAGRVSDV